MDKILEKNTQAPQKAKLTVAKIADKVKNATKKTGEYVEENPKTALYIGIGILAFGAVVLIFKSVKKASEKVDKLLDGDPNINNEIQVPNIPTPKATITDTQATTYAIQLLDAMNVKKPVYGTDNDVISAVFDKLKNGDDYIKVHKAFGKKDYNGYNSPPTGFWSNLDSYEKLDLNYWLKSELSSLFEPTLYKKVKARIESTGVFVF